MRKNLFLIVVFVVTQFSILPTAAAKDLDLAIKWSELRLFAGETTLANPSTQLKTLAQADGIPEVSKLTGFGMEIVGAFSEHVKIGAKFKGILFGSNKQDTKTFPTDYYQVQQYTAGATFRLALLNNESVFFDLFGEVGTANNSVQLSTAAGKGQWDKDGVLYQRAGTSIGIGGAANKLFIEAGYENIKMTGATFTGTVGNTISDIDLSGPYVMAGLTISGLPSWIKPK